MGVTILDQTSNQTRMSQHKTDKRLYLVTVVDTTVVELEVVVGDVVAGDVVGDVVVSVN